MAGGFTDDVCYMLADGDISKMTIITETEVEKVFRWLYYKKQEVLNNMLFQIAVLESRN